MRRRCRDRRCRPELQWKPSVSPTSDYHLRCCAFYSPRLDPGSNVKTQNLDRFEEEITAQSVDPLRFGLFLPLKAYGKNSEVNFARVHTSVSTRRTVARKVGLRFPLASALPSSSPGSGLNRGNEITMKTSATFFLTTARSGTQWIHHSLARLFPDTLTVEHEPIGYSYRPRLCLRNAKMQEKIRTEPIVARHLERIHRILETKSYVEVGFPSYGAMPLLVREFGDRLKIVQYLRHPVRVAASLVTQGFYDSGSRPDLEASISPQPFDPGARLQEFRGRWGTMSRFERGLYYWSEVHGYGRELRLAHPHTPIHRVRFEDLLHSSDEQRSLNRFLDLGSSPDWKGLENSHQDRFHTYTAGAIDVGEARQHPALATLAGEFGYHLDEIPQSEIDRRYVNFRRGAARSLRQRVKAILAPRVGGNSQPPGP